jgi:hypothetical protein
VLASRADGAGPSSGRLAGSGPWWRRRFRFLRNRLLLEPPADQVEGPVAGLVGHVSRHLLERSPDDIPMVHIEPVPLDRLEPQSMNEVQVFRRQGRRIRPELVGLDRPVPVADDQPRSEPPVS